MLKNAAGSWTTCPVRQFKFPVLWDVMPCSLREIYQTFKRKKLPQPFSVLLSWWKLQQVPPKVGKFLWVYTASCPSRHYSTSTAGSVNPLKLYTEVQTEGLYKRLQGNLRDVRGSSFFVAVRNLNLIVTDVDYRVSTKGLTTLYFTNFYLNYHIKKAKPYPVIFRLWVMVYALIHYDHHSPMRYFTTCSIRLSPPQQNGVHTKWNSAPSTLKIRVYKGKNVKLSQSTPWEHIGGVQVKVHSLLTSVIL
jgi:hypothetical protein